MISASNNHKISPIKFPKALIRVVAIFLESFKPNGSNLFIFSTINKKSKLFNWKQSMIHLSKEII